MLESLYEGLAVLASPEAVGYVILGSVIGLVFGALPGLGGVSALAVMLPFTFGMDPMIAMMFYAGIMGGVPFGGSIPAILINTPGTVTNAATCFDGHPMARRGEGQKAIGIAATSSALGAVFGLLVLIVLLPLVREIVLLIGPPELFMLVLFGIFTVSLVVRGNMVKGLVAGGIGILLSLIGFSAVFGVNRFTMGSEYLWDGIQLVPFTIGLFAVSQLISYWIKGGTIAPEEVIVPTDSILDGVREVFKYKATFLRSSAIGSAIGVIPGVGGAVANFVAYGVGKNRSKNPDTFGKGNPEGVVASEAANNSKDGGALLPTVGFGIPGSAEMAVLLGGFILHGLTPGPLLLQNHMDIVFALILGLLVSNFAAAIIGIAFSNQLTKLTAVPVMYIIPIVLTVCFVGPYAIRSNILDVVVVIVAGIFGYGLVRFGFSYVALIIGYILGVMGERALTQSLQISGGDYSIFVTRSISLILMISLVSLIVLPLIITSRREG